MRRRDFIKVIASSAVAWPFTARAQQPERMRRVGVLMGYAETDRAAQAQVAVFRQELQKLGWDEGRNIRIDIRFVGADAERVRAALMELTSLTPDVLVTNTNLVTAVVKAEIRTIPIVFISVGDPVGSGFVSNEVHPDNNVTGFANWESSISGKWVEVLKQVAPDVKRVAFMMEPQTPILVGFFKSAEAVAPSLKVKLVRLDVRNADEIERSLAAFVAEGNGGLVVSPSAVTFSNRDLIIALAARLRLPAIYAFAFYPKSGGLISYGFDPVNHFRQGAGYVDRILRGAKTADLPVQYPTKFQLVVNVKTAKAIGLAIPESFLLRADEVIE
jgi:putative ABC transport system substrate-binding protein